MSRLLMLLVLLVLVSAAAYLVYVALASAARRGRVELASMQPGNVMVQRTSYVVLLALIVYAAFWSPG